VQDFNLDDDDDVPVGTASRPPTAPGGLSTSASTISSPTSASFHQALVAGAALRRVNKETGREGREREA